mmetsp:Transcript_58999/g.126807  ORF Transcript_58999/g.126807 Transcript_58999/m.126807 type:complete len:210 (+) Transcript_58999:143-772(+)
MCFSSSNAVSTVLGRCFPKVPMDSLLGTSPEAFSLAFSAALRSAISSSVDMKSWSCGGSALLFPKVTMGAEGGNSGPHNTSASSSRSAAAEVFPAPSKASSSPKVRPADAFPAAARARTLDEASFATTSSSGTRMRHESGSTGYSSIIVALPQVAFERLSMPSASIARASHEAAATESEKNPFASSSAVSGVFSIRSASLAEAFLTKSP